MKQSGMSLVEMLIGLAIASGIMVVAITQFANIQAFFSGITAESSTRTELIQINTSFKNYFQTKWKGGLFDCATTPTIGTHSYCVADSSCKSKTAASYDLCKSMAIIRGDPLDMTTNPNRVRIMTECREATTGSLADYQFENTECESSCKKGEFPIIIFETTKADGTVFKYSVPAGMQEDTTVKTKISLDELRGAELCISKSSATNIVNVKMQAFYLMNGRMRNMIKLLSLPEITITNEDLELLP